MATHPLVSERKRIALVGFFGWGNFGDELFLEAHHQMLGKKYELFVANDITRAPYFSNGVEEIVSRADAILIGGGDLINPMLLSGLYWREEYLQRPTFIFGVGVPETTKQDASVMRSLKKFLEHPNCKLVVARDIKSRNWLSAQFNIDDKLYCFPDPVCAYRLPPPRRQPDQPVFGLVMREHRSLVENMLPVRTLADRARDLGFEVRHLVLSTLELREGDEARARKIARGDEQVVVRDSVRQLCGDISECTAMASIKFHGMVVAAMYGIPTIAMSSTPKNTAFLRSIQRPDLASSYLSDDLPEKLPSTLVGIHSLVRRNLARKSRVGYEVLLSELEAHV